MTTAAGGRRGCCWQRSPADGLVGWCEQHVGVREDERQQVVDLLAEVDLLHHIYGGWWLEQRL